MKYTICFKQKKQRNYLDVVAEKLGLTGKCKRQTMTRYEVGKEDCIRGQINKGIDYINETTNFYGPHFVECYIIKNDNAQLEIKYLQNIA